MKSVLLTESKHFWQMLTPTGRLGPSWKTRSICSGPSTSVALNRWMIPDPRVTVYIMLVSSVSSAFQTNPDGVKRCSRGPCRLLPVILINCLESMSCSPPQPHCSCTSPPCYLQKVSAGPAFYLFVVKCVSCPALMGPPADLLCTS